jgi:hypothetical protein
MKRGVTISIRRGIAATNYDGGAERGRLRDVQRLRPARGETLRAVQTEGGKDEAPGEEKKREEDKVLDLYPHGEEARERNRRGLARHQHGGQAEGDNHHRQVKELGGIEKDATAESFHHCRFAIGDWRLPICDWRLTVFDFRLLTAANA